MNKNLDETLKYCLIKEAFQTFDKDNDGYITCKEMGTVLRSMGQNLTEQDINDLAKIYDKEESGKIEFTEFFHLTLQRMKEPEKEEDLIEAFRLFDRSNEGTVPTTDIIHAMSNSLEKISKEEIEEFLKNIPNHENDQVNYEDFIRMMLAK